MKIVKIIKKILGKSEFNRKIYKKAKFFSYLLFFDFPDFAKIRLFAKIFPYTMVGYKRLSNVYDLAKKTVDNEIGGDFAECGVWKGGSTATMAFIAEKEGRGRKTWLFDSFEGLPEPTKEDGDVAKKYSGDKAEGNLKTIDKCVGTLEDVKKLFFKILKLKKENIMIEKGWFQDILPIAKEKIGKISILRLDGDWYESTKVCLDNLYDNVVRGGYIIIDDYGHWEGAKKALNEFFEKRNVSPKLIDIDSEGVYFKK
jgi:hypothetical protein